MGWGVFSEISSGVVLGEVCWYINMCELLVDYCNIASCCLSQVVIMRAWAGCWLSLPRSSFFPPWCSKVGAEPGWVDMSPWKLFLGFAKLLVVGYSGGVLTMHLHSHCFTITQVF